MRCPSCMAEMMTGPVFWVCGHCGSSLRREMGPSEAPDPARSRLAGLVEERFPFPIAHGFRLTLEAGSAAAGLKNLFFTYETTLRFVTLVLLAEFLRGSRQCPRLAQEFPRLLVPHLNDWHVILCTLAKHHFPLPASGEFPPFSSGGPFSAELVRATHRFRGFAVDGRSAHERILEARNNSWAHGGAFSETSSALLRETLLPVLEGVVELFRPLAELQPARWSGVGLVRLVGSVPGSASVTPEEIDPGLARDMALDPTRVVLLGPQGALPLFPLLVADATTDPRSEDPLHAFDGWRGHVIYYLGVASRTQRQDTVDALRALLAGKEIDSGFRKADLVPWRVSDWARESTAVTLSNLRGIKYFPETYQPRKKIDDVLENWLETGRESALLVAAEAGEGKTSMLCRLADRCLSRTGSSDPSASDAVLLVLGRTVGGGEGLFDRIRLALGFAGPASGGIASFAEFLEAWARPPGSRTVGERELPRLVLLVDAVNESGDTRALIEEAAGLAAEAAAFNRRLGHPVVRLVLSVRLFRLTLLLERWGKEHDAPFLPNPHNFAHFPEERGRLVPYLELRPFSDEEARAAYRARQEGSARHSRVPWEELAAGTRSLLGHPLMLHLFHEAFAGLKSRGAPGQSLSDGSAAPAVSQQEGNAPLPDERLVSSGSSVFLAEGGLWDAWLARTFDPREGSGALEKHALALADLCIERGEAAVSAELAADLCGRWREDEMTNDPVRIASSLDPIERLVESRLLASTGAGVFDWASDALAERVFLRTLLLRDPRLREESFGHWLSFPRTERLDGALVLAAQSAWKSGRTDLAARLTSLPSRRSRDLLGRLVRRLALSEVGDGEREEARRFGENLSRLCGDVVRAGGPARIARLAEALLWDVADRLADRDGAAPSLREILPRARELAEVLVSLTPGDRTHLRALAVCHSSLGTLEERTDPARARASFQKAVEVAEQLVSDSGGHPAYLRDLEVATSHLGRVEEQRDPVRSRVWYERAFDIAQRLARSEPRNVTYLADLVLSLRRLGGLEERSDRRRARTWHEKAHEAAGRLVALEPENTVYLRELALVCSSLGRLDERSDPGAARTWFERALEIHERRFALDPTRLSSRVDLAASLVDLGRVEFRADGPESARARFDRAREIQERLVALEPENRAYLADLAISSNHLGACDERTDASRARAWYLAGLGIRERLVQSEPENRNFLSNLSVSYGCLGGLEEKSDPDRARSWYEKGLAINEQLATSESTNGAYLLNLAKFQDRIGRIVARADLGSARASFERALAVRERLVALEPENAAYRRDLARSRVSLERLEEAANATRARALAEDAARIVPDLEPEGE
ncbi:MAG: SEL1-like repeat protein [Planctomycetes bacterium]|nr:SEL1-like repeat protein [Planctomycetota bacterium]